MFVLSSNSYMIIASRLNIAIVTLPLVARDTITSLCFNFSAGKILPIFFTNLNLVCCKPGWHNVTHLKCRYDKSK